MGLQSHPVPLQGSQDEVSDESSTASACSADGKPEEGHVNDKLEQQPPGLSADLQGSDREQNDDAAVHASMASTAAPDDLSGTEAHAEALPASNHPGQSDPGEPPQEAVSRSARSPFHPDYAGGRLDTCVPAHNPARAALTPVASEQEQYASKMQPYRAASTEVLPSPSQTILKSAAEEPRDLQPLPEVVRPGHWLCIEQLLKHGAPLKPHMLRSIQKSADIYRVQFPCCAALARC